MHETFVGIEEFNRNVDEWKKEMKQLNILAVYNYFYEILKCINNATGVELETEEVEKMNKILDKQQIIEEICLETKIVMNESFEIEKMEEFADKIANAYKELVEEIQKVEIGEIQ